MTQSNQTKSPFQIDPCDNTITLVRGNTCPLKITPTQEIEGVKSPYILQEGDKVIFTIQRLGENVLQKVLTNEDYDENQTLNFKINYEDTINLDITTYDYDAALQTVSGDFYTFVPLSNLKLVRNISQLIEDTSNEDGTTELGIISPALELTGIIEKAESVIEKDYDKLINKPSINDIELVGNKTFEEFGITDLVQNKLEASNIIAGENITLGVSGNNVTINSTGGGGDTGTDGKSAYEIAVENGFIGNETEWLESLKGESGDKGNNGIDGKSAYEIWLNEGNIGSELDFLNSLKGENGIDGINGIDGTSITSALVNNDGDLIVTLDTGVSLNAGHVKGADGTSINIKGDLLSPEDLPSSNQELGDCYIILGHLWVYVDSTDIGTVNGFKDVGNIKGEDGKSAYEIAIENGFIGTESEWLASLKGNKGDKGEDGYTPVKGTDYFTTADIESLGIANKVDKVEGKSLISDTEIERLSSVTNYDDSSKFNDNILKPTSLPFIGGSSLGWAHGTDVNPLASTTIRHPNLTENYPTLEYARIGLLEDSEEVFFIRGYEVTGYIGNTYTFSVSLYTEDNTSIDSSGILIQLRGKQGISWGYTEDVIVKNITSENLPNNKWTTFSITLKITEEVPYVEAIISVVRNATFFIAQYQVQEGEIATGFHPPPPRVVTSDSSGLMSPKLLTDFNKIMHTRKYSFIATNGNKLDPDDSDSTVDFVAGQNIALTVGYNDTLQADTITIDVDVSNKADTTYVDGLVAGINTELATKSTKPTIITNLSSTTQTVTLENNTEYRYGTLTSLTITWATSDIHCSMAFTGGTGVVFSITAGVKIVGTDVTDGVFAPVKGKRYNLGFEYDGINRTVYVSGV